MSRKRTSLDAILDLPTAGPAAPPAPAPAGTSRRPEVKQQTVYLPLAAYEQLRRLAFEERVKMHQLLMEGLAHSNYRSVSRLLKAKPTDVDTWVFARGQAILIAETGNLLLLRPPKNTGRDTWMRLASEMRTQATALARSTGGRDYARSKAALTNLTTSCNRCHQTFRVAAKVAPDPAPGERDTEE